MGDVPALPTTNPEQMIALLTASDRPVVLNVWASSSVPCRAEADLLRRAQSRNGDRIRFIGINVRDTQDEARAFIAQFGLTGIEHYFNRGGTVPAYLGAVDVPHTYFFAPGGDLVFHQAGVIDERTLALQIDELLRWGT